MPFVSWLAVLLLVSATVLCYCLPFRYVVMLAGSYQFAKGLLLPGSVATHDLLNFLACVPDNEQLVSSGRGQGGGEGRGERR